MKQSEIFGEPSFRGGALARRLGLFGTTMAVMGGIIGAGIFINPYLVAGRVHTSALILSAWIAGGLIALLGGFIYAELASRLPVVGGQYAYLREALHPGVAFLYGWVLLLVIQTGGMAAVAVTFARYFLELTHWQVNDSIIAASALALLIAINCSGVRAGSRVQSAMTLTAITAIGMLEACSFLRGGTSQISWRPLLDQPPSLNLAIAFGSAMTPVLFAYGGWHTSSFLSGEIRDPHADRRGHCLLRVRISGAILFDRATRLFCDGRRPRLFPQGGLGASADACSGRRDLLARRLGHRHRLDGHFRAGRQLRCGHGLPILWTYGRMLVCAAAPRGCSEREESRLSGPGPSLDDAALHRRGMDCGSEHVRARSQALVHWSRHRGRRIAGLLFVAREKPGGNHVVNPPERKKRSPYMEWAKTLSQPFGDGRGSRSRR